LINGWKLKPYSGSYSLSIIGNIFDVDGGAIFTPADNLIGVQNNININTNTSVIVRKISDSGGSDVDLTEINQKLDNQNAKLVSIENRIISIQSTNSDILSILSNPIDVNISQPQMNVIEEILLKVTEMWKIHGLSNDPITVNQNERKVSTIEQTFTKSGDDVIVNRIS
jgi:hypothetical protein